jgi:hypothetical protein
MVGFAWLFVVGFVLGCNPCKEEIWSTSTSPDGKWVAVTVMRDCGATTSEVVAVNVHPTNESTLRQKNNALVLKYGKTAGVSWRDAHTLALECRDCTANDIVAKIDNVGPIKITYTLPLMGGIGALGAPECAYDARLSSLRSARRMTGGEVQLR